MLASLGTMPELARQLSGLGGCIRPVRLDGHRTEYELNKSTGEIGRALHHLDSAALPAGHLLVRCNNRRATRCAACAAVSAPLVAYLAMYAATARSVSSWPPSKSAVRMVRYRHP